MKKNPHKVELELIEHIPEDNELSPMWFRELIGSSEHNGNDIDVSLICGSGSILIVYKTEDQNRSFVFELTQLVAAIISIIEKD